MPCYSFCQYEDGELKDYTCQDIESLKRRFREKNGTDKILSEGRKDRAYERYCYELECIQTCCVCNINDKDC